MTNKIKDWTINRICIIDDDEESRSAMELTIEDSQFTPIPQNDKVQNIDAYFLNIVKPHDAVVSDHHLKKKNYFPINGAEVVHMCYTKQIPSILVTKYDEGAVIDEIRRFRPQIPVILNPEEFEPDSLMKSLEICINEFRGEFLPSRKAWRSLIRVDSVDENHFYITIPSWNRNGGISLPKSDVPQEIRNVLKDDLWLHADVNIDASSKNDLFFINWEPK